MYLLIIYAKLSVVDHLVALALRNRFEDLTSRFRVSAKGGIAIGNDGDFTLVDLKATEIITTDSLHYRHKQSPYVGRDLRGRVRRTFLRGQTIFDDGKFAARPGGRLVRPDLL